jgi:hypothetical protein
MHRGGRSALGPPSEIRDARVFSRRRTENIVRRRPASDYRPEKNSELWHRRGRPSAIWHLPRFLRGVERAFEFPAVHSGLPLRPREKATRSIVRSIIITLEFRILFSPLVFRARFNYRRINVVAARVD